VRREWREGGGSKGRVDEGKGGGWMDVNEGEWVRERGRVGHKARRGGREGGGVESGRE
jgi:hypothetical protein